MSNTHTKAGLPVSIEPTRYAAAKRELEGFLAFANMPRLKEYLARPEGAAQVRLGFDKDEDNRVVISLGLDAELPLTCQRCLEEFNYPIHLERRLAPIASEAEAQQLPSLYEPVILEEDFLSPLAVVEEELILGLPLIPMHAEADCPAHNNSAYYGTHLGGPIAKEKPFAALAELKKKFK